MEQALALGALAEGSTSPNPRVGCLLVQGGRVVGQGFHRGPGQPHAEALAVATAGPRAEGATAYVNLEPCAHLGRTPPCAELLVQSGVRRVVAALEDPNPLVRGRGFAMLRHAGIEVDVGLLADPARRLNEAFLHVHESGLPLVTLKAALSLDGMISALGGRSRWISGPEARLFAHRLRLRHDALLVGSETVRKDDPRLTVRLPGVCAPRLRAVLAPTLELDPRSRLFQSEGTVRLYAAADAGPAREQSFTGRAEVVRAPLVNGQLDLAYVLSDLGRLGVQSVLVEGGGKTLGGFLESRLAQRAALFLSPRLLGARGGTPLVDRVTAVEPSAGSRLADVERIPLGDDLLLLGRIEYPCSPV